MALKRDLDSERRKCQQMEREWSIKAEAEGKWKQQQELWTKKLSEYEVERKMLIQVNEMEQQRLHTIIAELKQQNLAFIHRVTDLESELNILKKTIQIRHTSQKTSYQERSTSAQKIKKRIISREN